MTIAYDLFAGEVLNETEGYLRKQLLTYIGSKRALLPFINSAIEYARAQIDTENATFLDLFSGTGVVARQARRSFSTVITNDIEPYSALTNRCYQTNRSDYPEVEIKQVIAEIRDRCAADPVHGFIAELYAPSDEDNIQPNDRVFYTKSNAIILDTIASYAKSLDGHMRDLVLGPVLSQASKSVNTSGVFKGFYKNKRGIGQYGGEGRNALDRITRTISAVEPVLSDIECEHYELNLEASLVAQTVEGIDVTYIDPPYNQHPYGSNYFMLNLLCQYERPTDISRVAGIPSQWNRSPYNKRAQAYEALMNVVAQVDSRFVVLSYNSEGFIAFDEMVEGLEDFGSVRFYDREYNTFRGCRNLQDRDSYVTEFVFVLDRGK